MIEVIATVAGFAVTIGTVGVAAGRLSGKQDALSRDVSEARADVAELRKAINNGIKDNISTVVTRVHEHSVEIGHVKKTLDRLPCVSCER